MSEFSTRCFLIFLITTTVVKVLSTCELGDVCVTQKGENGTIRLDSDCPHFLLLPKKMMHPRICGWSGVNPRTPLICCSDDSRTTFERIDVNENEMISVSKMCKLYGSNANHFSSRIIGGISSEVGEFPHFASLGYQLDFVDGLTFLCGGALISPRFVISAAHCCKHIQPPVVVRLGKVRRFYSSLAG